MSRGDPFIVVICDQCESEEIEVGLTSLAGNAWDERDVNGKLKRAGWSVDGGKDLCADCAEEKE